jgi:hypothetical protein
MKLWIVECDEHGYLGSWGTLAEAIERRSRHCEYFGEGESEVLIYENLREEEEEVSV